MAILSELRNHPAPSSSPPSDRPRVPLLIDALRLAYTITTSNRARVCGQIVAGGAARAGGAVVDILKETVGEGGPQPKAAKRSVGELLTGFARVRAAWLDNAVTTMRLDDQYATAWLVGSLARGEGDVLSDIDPNLDDEPVVVSPGLAESDADSRLAGSQQVRVRSMSSSAPAAKLRHILE
jgi:hypothetical protein